MRWLMPMALALVLALCPVYAQPDPKQGTIQGEVTFDDGTPYAHTGVSITAGGEEFYADTDEKGIFTAQVPDGQAVVSVRETRQEVQVRGGETVRVTVKIPLTGVLLSLVTTAGKPMDGYIEQVAGGFRSEEMGTSRTYGETIGNGRYWFADVPANAKEFAAIACVGMGGVQAVRKRWTFDAEDKARRLTLTVAAPTTMKLRVTDAGGQPLRERSLRGFIAYDVPQTTDAALWGDGPFPTTPTQRRLSDISTDRQGHLVHEGVAAGTYRIWLLADDRAGAVAKVEVKADGAVTPASYALTIGRHDVAQTVFGADGKPAAGAVVNAVYGWQGKAMLVTQTADAAGKITWKDLPPVRTITWGDRVPAGVIPPDATTITAPLPAPVRADEGIGVSFTLANPDPMIKQLAKVVRGLEFYEEGFDGDFDPPVDAPPPAAGGDIDAGDVPQPLTISGNGQPGASFSALIWTRTPVPLVATYVNTYVPYADAVDAVDFPLVFKPGARLRGKFVAKDGTAVPGVSELGIAPVAVGPLQSLLEDPAVERGGLMLPMEEADGSFTVALPVAGDYRLLVDMFDRTAGTTPELLVHVPGGNVEKTFALPEPLAVVPVGTELNWVTWNAPADARTVVAAALGPRMPIFGPREQVLALWYRPSPDKLVVVTPWDAANPTRTLELRTVYLKAGANDYGEDWAISPLLPTAMAAPYGETPAAPRRHARAESLPTSVRQNGVTRVNLWPGKYALRMSPYDDSVAGVVEVPADGPREITVQAAQERGTDGGMRSIRLAFPRAEYATLREKAAQYMTLYADGAPVQQEVGTWGLEGGEDQYLEVPVEAKTLAVQWLGVGVIRDVRLPAHNPDNGDVRIQLPGWQPGITIAGKLLDAAGGPMAKTALRVGGNLTDYSYTAPATTDDEGRFSVVGGMPGMVFVMGGEDGGNDLGAWTVTVTDAGTPNLVLTPRPDRPRITMYNEEYYGWDSATAWWLPAAGAPVRLPWRYGEIVTNSLTAGPGTLWVLDANQGRGRLVPITEQASHMDLSGGPTGPTLGITFPFDITAGSLGRVTLDGQGARKGVSVTIHNPAWQYCPQLGLVVGQVSAVPAGTYTVTVQTGRGRATDTVTINEQGGALKLAYPPQRN